MVALQEASMKDCISHAGMVSGVGFVSGVSTIWNQDECYIQPTLE